MTKPPASEQIQVNFRMPAYLRDRIKLAADLNGRSVTSEIVEALEKQYPTPYEQNEKFLEFHKLLTRFLYNRESFTDEDEYRMNSIIVELKAEKNAAEARDEIGDD